MSETEGLPDTDPGVREHLGDELRVAERVASESRPGREDGSPVIRVEGSGSDGTVFLLQDALRRAEVQGGLVLENGGELELGAATGDGDS